MPDVAQGTLLTDGTLDFVGGQNAAQAPSRIPDNCVASGVNISVKQGIVQPRWGIERKTLTFPDGGVHTRLKNFRSYRYIFEAGKFQAAIPYYVGNTLYLIAVFSGHIFAINPDTGVIVPIALPDGSTLNPRASRINREVAGRYLVFHDFPNYPVILEGLSARRADPDKMEIPVSVLGAFNQNRLYIANAGIDFTGGDPAGNTMTPNAPITFEEYLTEASPYYLQSFQPPTVSHNAPISYMGFLQMTDTSTGIGPLIVATPIAIYTFATNTVRANWQQGQFGSLLCFNAGVVGPRAFTNVNSDAFFIANDGYVRSLSMARDEARSFARVPISREVEPWFKFWDLSLAKFAFVSCFKNKVFFSVNPYRIAASDFESGWPISDYAFGGFAVMELDNMTAFGQASKPTWAGLWTGTRPMDMVVTDDGNRAFVFSKDGNVNTIYEVDPNNTYDRSGKYIRYVRSRIVTKDYNFKDPFMNKELHSLRLNMQELRGDVKLNAEYKPSHGDTFRVFGGFEHAAPWRACKCVPGCLPTGYAGHSIRDLIIPAPDDNGGSPATDDLYRVFKRAQLRLTISGKYWELHELMVLANARPQPPNITSCETKQNQPICAECSDDWRVDGFGGCEETIT